MSLGSPSAVPALPRNLPLDQITDRNPLLHHQSSNWHFCSLLHAADAAILMSVFSGFSRLSRALLDLVEACVGLLRVSWYHLMMMDVGFRAFLLLAWDWPNSRKTCLLRFHVSSTDLIQGRRCWVDVFVAWRSWAWSVAIKVGTLYQPKIRVEPCLPPEQRTRNISSDNPFHRRVPWTTTARSSWCSRASRRMGTWPRRRVCG